MQDKVLKDSGKYSLLPLLSSSLLYFLLGYVSLTLDDPGSRIAFIWLPAGVAVSAFLLFPRRNWALLFLSLFTARLLLDVSFRHSLSVSLGLSAISLMNDFSIAWFVRCFTRGRDELFKVINWIMATLFISAIAAFLGVMWLSLLQGTPPLKGIWIWWSANVTGTLFVTPALVGLVSLRNSSGYVSKRMSLLLIIAILLITLLIFTRTPPDTENIALTYSVACLPLGLVTLVAILCDSRLASVAFILFSIVVMTASWYETGPFYIGKLSLDESIVLAQCYLSGSALLIVFIRAQKRFRRADPGEYLIQDIAYSLDPLTGNLSWNPHASSPLCTELSHITTRETLLAHIPDDRHKAQMQSRWQAVLEHQAVDDGFRFMLHLDGHNPVLMCEKNTLFIAGSESHAIIGFWTESRVGQPEGDR